MEFILHVTGVDGLVAKFTKGAEKALDPIAPFSKIIEDMFRIEAAVFSSQGRRGGGSWKPLKAETVSRKGSSRILESSGALRESLSVEGAEYQILHVDRTGFVFGTDRPFAAVHQYGSESTGNPARPFLKFMASDIGRWNHWLIEHMMEPFKVK